MRPASVADPHPGVSTILQARFDNEYFSKILLAPFLFHATIPSLTVDEV